MPKRDVGEDGPAQGFGGWWRGTGVGDCTGRAGMRQDGSTHCESGEDTWLRRVSLLYRRSTHRSTAPNTTLLDAHY